MRLLMQDPRTHEVKTVKVGWSWTCFFFTQFFGVPLFLRGLIAGGIVAVVAELLWLSARPYLFLAVLAAFSANSVLGLATAVLLLGPFGAFPLYWGLRGNKKYLIRLLERGWQPLDPNDAAFEYALSRWDLADSVLARRAVAHKACPFCNEEILADAIKCKHCGETLQRPDPPPRRVAVGSASAGGEISTSPAFCTQCGTPVPNASARFCGSCGAALTVSTAPSTIDVSLSAPAAAAAVLNEAQPAAKLFASSDPVVLRGALFTQPEARGRARYLLGGVALVVILALGLWGWTRWTTAGLLSQTSVETGKVDAPNHTNTRPPVRSAAITNQVRRDIPTQWAPSFDCARASTRVERLICADEELAHADVRMADLYRRRLSSPAGDADLLRTGQVTWRSSERDTCPDISCLRAAYEARIAALTDAPVAPSEASASVATEREPLSAQSPDTRGIYRPGNGVVMPRVLREWKPQYTSDAMRAKVEGSVSVECVVKADGTVGSVEVVRSLDRTYGLDDEAIKAAKQWKFAPGTKDGIPVAVVVTIELTFTLK